MGNGNALNKRVRARFGTAHLVAVVAGLLTAVLLLSFTRSQEALMPVLIASEDIRAGTVISSEHLGVVEVPSGSGVVASLHPASSREGLVGQVATRSIAQSEPVLRSDTRPIAAQDGRRAMSFPMLASHAVGGDVSVGDEVDVLVVAREGTRFVAESVPVLAVPPPGSTGLAGATSSWWVVLSVDETEALLIADGVEHGTVYLLRSTGSLPLAFRELPIALPTDTPPEADTGG